MSSFGYKPFQNISSQPPGITTVNGEPLTSFGEMSVAELTPAGQGDFIYGINNQIFTVKQFSGGTITSTNGMATVQSGISSTGSSILHLRRNLKYKPGMGSLSRLTALFDTPASQNYQLAGIGNPECGYYFGYNGTNFGIFHFQTGQKEIRKVTINTAAGTQNVNVTLNGVTVAVPVTGGSDVNRTAYELARYDYTGVGTGWFADAIDGAVYFISALPGTYTGSYSLTGTGAASGSFTSILAGSGSTMTFTSQSSWNIDRMDGGQSGALNASKLILNPLMGNVYQIGFQYLGFGNAFFAIENPDNGRMMPVHMIKNTGARTTPVLKNPQMSTRVISQNIGNTTNVQPKTVSMAEFTEGKSLRLDPRFAATGSFASLTSTSYVGLLAVKVNRTFNNLTCNGEIDALRIAASSNSNGISVAVFKNVQINGVVNFSYVDQTNSIVSTSYLGATGTSLTLNGTAPLVSFSVGNGGAAVLELNPEDMVVSSGEILVIAVKTFAGNNPTGEVAINWFEQQ